MRYYEFTVEDKHYLDNKRVIWFKTPDDSKRIVLCGDWEYIKEISDLTGKSGIALIPTEGGTIYERTPEAEKWFRGLSNERLSD